MYQFAIGGDDAVQRFEELDCLWAGGILPLAGLENDRENEFELHNVVLLAVDVLYNPQHLVHEWVVRNIYGIEVRITLLIPSV